MTVAPHVAVVILHWGPPEVTARCLRSLTAAAWPGRVTVIVVDNTQALAEEVAASAGPLDVHVIRPERNLGFADGCTRGMSAAVAKGADWLLLLNNDVVVEPGFLGPLLEAAEGGDDVGLVSPQIVHLGRPREAWYQGGTFSPWSGIPVQGHRRPAMAADGPAREVDYATGCAMLVRPAVIERVGSFDGDFFAYCEDLDLSIRARRAGFRVMFAPGSTVSHDVSDEPHRAALRIYYSTRNLLEVMRRHAAWYEWLGFGVNFLVRWVGFFVVLALVRGEPRDLEALGRGMLDFAGRKLGPSPRVADPRART